MDMFVRRMYATKLAMVMRARMCQRTLLLFIDAAARDSITREFPFYVDREAIALSVIWRFELCRRSPDYETRCLSKIPASVSTGNGNSSILLEKWKLQIQPGFQSRSNEDPHGTSDQFLLPLK